VKLLLVLSLILTAALLFVSFAGAGELVPNELGRIMILEYHKIDYPEAQWTRTPENFRRDLETLYAKGYRVINMGDLLDRRITLPAGTTPVVLTFDDSSPGQFRYLEKNGSVEIRPQVCRGHPRGVLQGASGFRSGAAPSTSCPARARRTGSSTSPPTRARSCSSWRAPATRSATTRSGTPTSPNTRGDGARAGGRRAGVDPEARARLQDSHPGAAARRVSAPT